MKNNIYISVPTILDIFKHQGLSVKTIETTEKKKTIEVNGKTYTATIDELTGSKYLVRTYPEQMLAARCYKMAYYDVTRN